MTTEIVTAGLWECDGETYHQHSEIIGNSLKEHFLASRKNFNDINVACTRPKPDPTRALNIGTWAHVATFEQTLWAAKYISIPRTPKTGKAEWDLRTTAHKGEQAEFRLEHADKKILDFEDYTLVMQIREALYANRKVRAILEAEGPCEQALKFTDPHSGLLCKNRRDKVLPDCIVDLKTSDEDVSPAGFQRTVKKRAYQRNADFYVRGHLALTGETVPYVFLVVSKDTFECGLYELDDAWMAEGYEQNAWALEQLARCRETGDWESDHEHRL